MGEQFYYIFYSLLSGVTNLIAFTGFLVKPLNQTQKLIFIFSGTTIYYLHIGPLHLIPANLVIGILVGVNLLLVFLFQQKRLLNLFCVILCYVFSVVMNNLVLIVMDGLGVGMEWIAASVYREFIFLLLQILWLYICTSILRRFIRYIYIHKLTPAVQHISSRKYFFVLSWATLPIIGFFVINLTYSLMADYPASLRIYNCVSFTLLFIILGITIFLLLRSIQKEHMIQLKQVEQTALREYTMQIESLYLETRAFKHDYQNILSTMNGYIATRDYEKLETYFTQKLSLMDNESSRQNAILGKLVNVEVPELKGLLYYKLFTALQSDLQTVVDIPVVIGNIPMDIMDFIRMLGILLDNALEAAAATEDKYFYVGLEQLENGLAVTIENSSAPVDNIELLFQKNYSTKGTDRGIGLWEVRNLLKSHPQTALHTNYRNGRFLQELEIACQ